MKIIGNGRRERRHEQTNIKAAVEGAVGLEVM